MTNAAEHSSLADRELVLTRIIEAPREKIFQAWTEPELLKQWFAPQPFTTPVVEIELRPGGANLIVMQDPRVTSSQTVAFILKWSGTSVLSSPTPMPAAGSRRKSRS